MSKASAAENTSFKTEMPICETNVVRVCRTRTSMLDPDISPSIVLEISLDSFTCKPPF